jgi:hypothetical protein
MGELAMRKLISEIMNFNSRWNKLSIKKKFKKKMKRAFDIGKRIKEISFLEETC